MVIVCGQLIGAFPAPQSPLIRHWNAAIRQRLVECLKVRRRVVEGGDRSNERHQAIQSDRRRVAAILTALRVRINDLHRLADNIDASDDPGDLRKQAVDLSILHDKLAAGSN